MAEYIYDGRGSVAAEVSYNNAWYTLGGILSSKGVISKSYTPFGEQIGEASSGFGYNGEYYNAATGMVYLRARFYEPEMNRFSQKDVVRGSVIQPGSLNRYSYVQNDPVNFIDPSGRSLKSAASALVGALTGVAKSIVSGVSRAASSVAAKVSTSAPATGTSRSYTSGPTKSTAQNFNPNNIMQSTSQAIADARKAAYYMNATAPGSPAARQTTQAYMETMRLASIANTAHNTNIARQAYQTSQFSVNRVNNVATGRLPNTYMPYDSSGNATSYYNRSRQAGKTPSPDAPRVEDVSVSDNPSYCANGKYGYGEYTYKNVVYSIYVPGPNSSIYDDGWKTIDKNKVLAGIKIDWAKVLSGSLESINIDPINAGYYQVSSGIVTNKTGLASSAAIQVVTGILKETEILNALLYIQEKEGEYRAVITASSSVAQQKYDLFANGKPIFLGLSNQGLASMSAKRLYEELSGKDVAWYLRGDVVVTIDPGHRGNGEVAYLWYDDDKLMGTPIIYAGDKIEVGVLEGLLGLTFKDRVEVPINTSPFEMSEYSEALIKGFNEKGE